MPRSKILHSHEDVTIAGEYMHLGQCSVLMVLSRGDLYRATPAVTGGARLCGLIQRTSPFSRLVRQARDTESFSN